MGIRRSHALTVALCAAVLTACGGSQPDEMAKAGSGPAAEQALATMAQPGPSMAAVLGQPAPLAPTAPTAAADGPTVKRQDASVPAARSPDLIWLNASTGLTVSWTMSGLQIKQQNVLLQHPDWRITQVADLDGDGQDDYVWENDKDGQMAVWLMKGPALADAGEIKLLLQSPGWKVAFTGDFNGDGKSDLLYYNATTNQTVIWLMDGSRILESQVIDGPPGARVIAVADLDGDGRSDLVWRVDASTIETWLMQGTRQIGGRGRIFCDASCQGDFAARLADADGSGRAALAALAAGSPPRLVLMQSEAEGLSPWTTIASTPFSDNLPSGTGATIQAVADLHGDGVATALVRDPATSWTLATRPTRPAQAYDTPVALLKLPGWKVIHTPDLDGDGKADLIWHHPDSGLSVAWLMDGPQAKLQSTLFQHPQWAVTATRNGTAKPKAIVGAQQTLKAGDTATVDGSASLPRGTGALTYRWTLAAKPTGSTAALSDATAAKPTFKADQPGRYVARLVVTRGGLASAAATTAIEATAAPSALAEASIWPVLRAAGSGSSFDVELRLAHALNAGHLLCLEVPKEFGTLWERDVSFYVNGGPFEFTWNAVHGRQLCASSSTAIAANTGLTAGVRSRSSADEKGFRNPATPGTYLFKVWTTTDPTPVEIPVRILPEETKPQDFHYAQDYDPVLESRSLGIDFVTPSGLPKGARIRMYLSNGGVDISGAKLAAASDVLQLLPTPISSTWLTFVVTATGGIPAGTRVTAEQTRVTGVRDYRCAWPFPFPQPAPTATLSTSEDLLSVTTTLPVTGATGAAVGGPVVTFVPDPTYPGSGRWQLQFRATNGLPAGSRVHLSQVDYYVVPTFRTGPFGFFGGCDMVLDVTSATQRDRGQIVTLTSGLEQRPLPNTFTFTLYTSADDTPVKFTTQIK